MKKKSLTKEELSHISFSKLKKKKLTAEEEKIMHALFAQAADETRKSFATLSTQLADVTRKALDASSAQIAHIGREGLDRTLSQFDQIADVTRKSLDYMKGDNQPGPVNVQQDIVKLMLSDSKKKSDSDEEKLAALERLIERFPSLRQIKIYRKSVDRLKKGSLYAALMAVINASQKDGREIEDRTCLSEYIILFLTHSSSIIAPISWTTTLFPICSE